MRNIRLTLAYDGSGYVGWQEQPNGLSVQAAVEGALRQLTGADVTLLAAGRTDAGVHALGQVASFRTNTTIPSRGFRAGLQTYLPRDIVVLDAEEVELSFHATHSAKRKRYRYVILNQRAGHPFLRRYAHEVHPSLDDRAMHTAAQALVGRHDFRAFETGHPNTATSVRTIYDLAVGRQSGWPGWSRMELGAPGNDEASSTDWGDFVWIEIVADGFLYNMVRTIAGTLIRIGEQKWNAADLLRILRDGDRRQAGSTAPACGLYLVRVDYDDVNVSTSDRCVLDAAAGDLDAGKGRT